MVLELDPGFPVSAARSTRAWRWRSTAGASQDAYLVPLNPETEIYLIPRIGGG
jgi:hypothetical protein